MNSKKKILLIGDCSAMGTNCLLDQIMELENLTCLEDYVPLEKEKQIVAWYLKNKIEPVNIKDVVNSAYKFKIKKEKEIAWPSFLQGDVKNSAKLGTTFLGMYIKVKNYVDENGLPDFIVITDFTWSHMFSVINHQGKKILVERDIEFLNHARPSTYNAVPNEVYSKFLKNTRTTLQKGENFLLRKNLKALNILIKYINKLQVPYKIFSFNNWFKKIYKESIDCSKFTEKYKINGIINLKKKREEQIVIANFVQQHID